jgi:hypothetical protein
MIHHRPSIWRTAYSAGSLVIGSTRARWITMGSSPDHSAQAAQIRLLIRLLSSYGMSHREAISHLGRVLVSLKREKPNGWVTILADGGYVAGDRPPGQLVCSCAAVTVDLGAIVQGTEHGGMVQSPESAGVRTAGGPRRENVRAVEKFSGFDLFDCLRAIFEA